MCLGTTFENAIVCICIYAVVFTFENALVCACVYAWVLTLRFEDELRAAYSVAKVSSW